MVIVTSVLNRDTGVIVCYTQEAFERQLAKMDFDLQEFYFENMESDLPTFDLQYDLGLYPSNLVFLDDDDDCTVLEFQGPGASKQESGNTNNSGNHGVVNYNFYNTQYQNSIDMSHLMEQANTAYGHSGGITDSSRGDSTNSSSSSVTNLLASGAQLAAGLLPLLADGLTEDFENSDRVDVRQAGATTLATQHTAGVAGYTTRGTAGEPTSTADEGYGRGPAVERFVTIKIGEWTISQAYGTGWYLPLPYSVLQRNTPAASLARRHYTFNSGWRVHVQVNSTRFHGGCLGVFLVPQYVNQGQQNLQPGSLSSSSVFNYNSFYLYPHQLLNPRTNSSCDIEVPYAHFSPAAVPSQDAPWTLVVMVVSPLSYSTGATTSLEVVASITPTDPTFHGIRQTDAQYQGLPKADLCSSTYTWSSTEPHTAEPDYGNVVRSSPSYLPAEFTDLLQIARVPTLCTSRSFDVQQVPAVTAVYSLNASIAAVDLANTALETVSRGFAQYRGSIVLRFVFVGNQMQNTRILASYTPPGADAPTTVEQAADGVYAIYDTGLNSAFEFVIPYISPYDFRYCNGTDNTDLASGGYVTVWQLTSLAVPPGSPTTAQFMVFASAGMDFEYRLPTVPYASLQGEGPVAPAETGHTPEHDAGDSNENPNPIPFSPARLSHTSLRFWFDRYFFSLSLNFPGVGGATATAATVVALDWDNITRNIPEVRWFMHATYFRFELELALVPRDPAPLTYIVTYYPPGTAIPTGNWSPEGSGGANGTYTESLAIERHGATPQWRWNAPQTTVFTTRIPFVSPASCFTQTHAGFRTWNHATNEFGIQPLSNSFGAIVVANSGSTVRNVQMYVRFVDIQCWCPRPGIFLEPPAQQSRGMSNFALLRLAGDVEENPGPTLLSKLFLGETTNQLLDRIEGGANYLKSFLEFEKWIDMAKNTTKQKLIEKFLKFLGMAILAWKCKSDPLLAAAVGFIAGGSWLSKMFMWVRKWLAEHMLTPAPPLPRGLGGPNDTGDSSPQPKPRISPKDTVTEQIDKLKNFMCVDPQPKLSVQCDDGDVPLIDISKNVLFNAAGQISTSSSYPEDLNPFQPTLADKFKTFFKLEGPLQDANALVQLCKNAEWIAEKFKLLMEWLGLWKKQEQEATVEHWNKQMERFPHFIEKYQECKCFPNSVDFQNCKQYFDEMRRLAVRHNERLLPMFPNMSMPAHQNSRQEPILVVLRGPPGQGKSVAAALLAQMLAFSSSGKPDYYSYNSSTNFFDGYRQQPVVLIDDLGQNPTGTDFSVFCQMISTTPFHPNMADLKDKGTLFTSDFIIATTNLPSFRPVTVSDPAALDRRINFDYNVLAGQNYRTSKGTLDLAAALKPTGCSSPVQFARADLNLFSSACLSFTDSRKVSSSLIQVYDQIMALHRSRNELSTKLEEVFTFQGPDPLRPGERAPCSKQVEKFLKQFQSDRSLMTDEDICVLNCLEKYYGNGILLLYIETFYPRKRTGLRFTMTRTQLEMVLQVLYCLMMFLTLCVFVGLALQGPYSGNAPKRPKIDGLKMVDIASLQGPHNHDLELSIYKKNTVKVICREADGSEFVTTGLMVKRRLGLMNFHLWQRATHIGIDGQLYDKKKIPTVRVAIEGEPSEIVAFNMSCVPGREYRDISGLFPTRNQLRIPPNSRATGIVANGDFPFMFTATPLGISKRMRTWESIVPGVVKYKADTAPGFCGAPLIIDCGLWKKVYGIHCAGGHGIGAAALVTQEMLAAICSLPDLQGRIQNVKPHPFVYTPRKTQLYPTVAQDDSTTVEPAPLSINDPRLEQPENFKKTIMAKHIGDRTTGPLAMLRMARIYARIIRSECGEVSKRLSLQEAVEGTDNLDPMDMDRSPGWPYLARGQRRRQLYNNTGTCIQLDPVLKAELALMMEGNYEHHKFVTFLKDELRDKEKVKAGKTRVIDIASFGHAIMGRVLFGRLAAAMHAKNGTAIGSAVGCNPDIDWFRYAQEFQHRYFVDIDYSGFDSTHTTFAFTCLKEFLQELGFDGVSLAYVDSLCNSTHIWDDEQFEIIGGLPSGCSMTSIFNTIMNNIVVRALLPHVLPEGAEFQMLAYGDDLVLNVDTKFDAQVYKELIESVTNYKITPASKSGTFHFGGLEDVVFLKRWWVHDGLLIRPVMSYANLHNILSYARAGTVQEKLNSVARLAQHRGREDYHRLMKPFEECGYIVPSFDELELEFFGLFFG